MMLSDRAELDDSPARESEPGGSGTGSDPAAGHGKSGEGESGETATSAPDSAAAPEPGAEKSDVDGQRPTPRPRAGKFDGDGVSRLGALRRPPVLVAVVVITLLTAGLAYTGGQLRNRNAQESARSTALASAREYALSLTTYDHRDLQGNFGSVTGNSSPKFARQYKEVSDGLTQLIQQYQATSKGNVLKEGVLQADEDRAVLVLFVDQTITNSNSPQPRVDRTRMQMTLVRPEGRWLIDDVQLI